MEYSEPAERSLYLSAAGRRLCADEEDGPSQISYGGQKSPPSAEKI